MSAQSAEEAAMAQLLVQALNLDSVEPGAIAPDAPLFGQAEGSLGLDSIDALEIALAISQKYGVELRSEDEATKKAFGSLSKLAAHVAGKRAA